MGARRIALLMFFAISMAVGQSARAETAPPASPNSGPAPAAIKADSVTINMPDGVTREQADAILSELKAIHQLLQNQQGAVVAAAPSPAPAVNDTVKMTVGKGWYAMGREDAPVTMVEFTDYQCPFCRRFESETFPQLKKEYIDTGKVRFVSRDLPLDIHPNALAAAVAARCAGDQGKFWEIREAMMLDAAAELGADALTNYARTLNLDMAAFNNCISDKKDIDAIKKDTADAGALGISGTPSFVIGKSDSNEIVGVRVVGAVPFSTFDSTIKDALAAK